MPAGSPFISMDAIFPSLFGSAFSGSSHVRVFTFADTLDSREDVTAVHTLFTDILDFTPKCLYGYLNLDGSDEIFSDLSDLDQGTLKHFASYSLNAAITIQASAEVTLTTVTSGKTFTMKWQRVKSSGAVSLSGFFFIF